MDEVVSTGWLYNVARSLSADANEVEDLMQEGRIAMWKAQTKFDPELGSQGAWLSRAARLQMKSVAFRKTWTGLPQRGRENAVASPPPVDTSQEEGDSYNDPGFSRVLDRGYTSDIVNALGELTDRERDSVIRKFWLDEVVTSTYWNRAKGKLRVSLAHLREEVTC